MEALRGIGLILKTPRLWPLCFAPVFASLVAYVGIGAVVWWRLGPQITAWLGQWAWLGEFALIVFWVVLFPYAFLLLGSGFLGLFFEPLAKEVEKTLGETPPPSPLKFRQTALDSLARLLLNGGLGLVALVAGFVLGPIPGILVAAVVGLLDYTSVAFLRRGITLKKQAKTLLIEADGPTLIFGAVAGVLSLVPIVGLLLAPGLIAGGVLLTRRRLG